MTITTEEQRPPTIRNFLSPRAMWFILSLPATFATSLLALAAVLVLSLVIPQQPAELSTPGNFVIWLSNLPQAFQTAFQPLNILGLFKIYRTAWFWLPVAWVTLSCLIIVADYIPATWQRFWKRQTLLTAPLRHPLSHYEYKTILLNAPQQASESTSTEGPLTELKGNLIAQGYTILPFSTSQETIAVRNAWRWSSPVMVMLGILLIILGAVIQTIWGQAGQAVLTPQATTPTTIAGQAVILETFTPVPDRHGNLLGGHAVLDIGGENNLIWPLYRFYRQDDWWLIPVKIEPVAQITFEQEQTSEKVNLILQDTLRPVRFIYSPESLSFELSYVATNQGSDYRLRIIESSRPAGVEPAITQAGQRFVIPDLNLSGQVVIKDRLVLRAYKTPGLIPFILGGLVFLLGMIQFPLPGPSIVRLQVITKGRGSRIEANVETLGISPTPVKNTLVLAESQANDS